MQPPTTTLIDEQPIRAIRDRALQKQEAEQAREERKRRQAERTPLDGFDSERIPRLIRTLEPPTNLHGELVETDLQLAVVLVTPALAAAWLRQQAVNRKLSDERMLDYSDAMLAGHWKLNGETLIFDNQDQLINGQHRLSALIHANVTLPMLTVRGVSPDAFTTIDTGKSRMVSDYLHMAGYTYSHLLPTVANAVHNYDTRGLIPPRAGGGKRGRRFPRLTPEETLAHLDANYSLYVRGLQHYYRTGFKRISPGIYAACYAILSRLDQSRADSFFDQLDTGADLPKTSPILRLRGRIIGIMQQRAYTPHDEQAALVLKAWNAWRSGEEMHVLVWKPTVEPFPVAKP